MPRDRTPLSEIEPTGARRTRLRALPLIAAIAAAAALLGLLMPWHELAGETHTALDHGAHGAAIPPVVGIGFAVACWLRPTFRWCLGWAALAALAAFAGFVAVVTIELTHLFDSVQPLAGLELYFWGMVIELVAGVVALLAVPIEFVRARRELRADGQLPTARAVALR
jgi:hypothetical protein